MNRPRTIGGCKACGRSQRTNETGLCPRCEAELRADIAAENAFERRAAFGPGVDVVNVITGERFRT